MNVVRRLLGYLWIILGPISIVLMIFRASYELQNIKPEKIQETTLFWIITIAIFVPIAFGFTIFGWYALKGEYSKNV